MKNLITILLLATTGLLFAQPVRTTITDDGTNVTISTPVNTKVVPICDFHWSFTDGQLQMWLEGRNELIPGGRLGNFTINGATTQASKLAALGAISAQCGSGGSGSQIDSAYLDGDTLVLAMSPSDITTPGVGNIFSTSGVAKGAKIWSLGNHMQQWSSTSYPYLFYFGESGYGFGTNDLSNSRFHFIENSASLRSVRFGNTNTAGGMEIRSYAEASTAYTRMGYIGSTFSSSGWFSPSRGFVESNGSAGLVLCASNAAGNLFFATGGLGGANIKGVLQNDGKWGWGTNAPTRQFEWSRSVATTNAVEFERKIVLTTGTAAAGLGHETETYIEDAGGNVQSAGAEAIVWADASNGSEDANYYLHLQNAGTRDTAFSVNSFGDAWPRRGFLDTSGDIGTSGQVLKSTGTGTNWTSTATYQAFTTTTTLAPVDGGFYTVNGNGGAWTATITTSSLNAGDTFTIKGYQVSTNNVTLDASSGGFIDVDADIASPQATWIYNTTSAFMFTWDGTNLHIY